jgi:hypothetical protein
LSDLNAQSEPWSFHTASAFFARYRYSCEDGAANVSSPETTTGLRYPGSATLFSWLCLPMP